MTGDDIKALRHQLDLSQAGFAELLGCAQHHVSRWESGIVKPGKGWASVIRIVSVQRHQPDMKAAIDRIRTKHLLGLPD